MFLLIDKPKGMTSHDVVDKVREITGENKVGHAGTLDPNATGLLVVGVGRESTRKLSEIAKATTKTYEAEIVLGEERDTDDVEGVVISKVKGLLPPGKREIEKTIDCFQGWIDQIPPTYSAIKLKGKKAYELARKGKIVNLKPRRIRIHSIELVDYSFPYLRIICEVSSGTYIRSLARDFGRKLGVGAYLNNLRRLKIGEYDVLRAADIKFLTKENYLKFTVTVN